MSLREKFHMAKDGLKSGHKCKKVAKDGNSYQKILIRSTRDSLRELSVLNDIFQVSNMEL